MTDTNSVFVSGGTGYLGRHLTPALSKRGHKVRVLVRPGSEGKVPDRCDSVLGNALDSASFADWIPNSATLVHLVGVSRPAPWKAAQFEAVDLASVRASTEAALRAGVEHFVYVSVAHPAPVMKAYWRVRARCEEVALEAGLRATFLRPWYVLGPGHRWPLVLRPLLALFEQLPPARATARRLGFVKLSQMVDTLVWAVENRPEEVRIIDVRGIRRSRSDEKLCAVPSTILSAKSR